MTRRSDFMEKFKSRQQGAVAIIVALCLVVLVGMLGLVLDLGHLYVTKTELQNAADAAALSGAERLDGTLCRVNSSIAGCNPSNKGAVQLAIETAGQNKYGFNKLPVVIAIGDIYLGSCPDRDRPGATDTDGCVMVSAASIDDAAEAAGLSFLQVDTGNRAFSTWFAKIWNIMQMQTYAMAVAGRYVTQISPVAVCAINNIQSQYVSETGNWPKYLSEFGFRRGTTYELGSINVEEGAPPGILSGTQLYVHPTAQIQSECQGNPPDMAPYLCGGKSTLTGIAGSVVYSNTGLQSGKSQDAFNTRFLANVVNGCESVSPDTDTTDFTPTYAQSWMNFTNTDSNPSQAAPSQSAIVNLAVRLANPQLNIPAFAATQSAKEDNNNETGGCSDDCRDNYGVLWSNYRPLKKNSDADVPVEASPSDWPSLYLNGPAYVGNSWTAKYTGNERRIINTLIVNCSGVVGNGSCAQIPVLGVGKFLLQTDVTTVVGTNVYGEFGGLISAPLPSTAQIRLYR